MTPTRKSTAVHHPHLRPLHRHPHGSHEQAARRLPARTDPRPLSDQELPHARRGLPVGDVFVQGVAFRKGDPLRDEYNTILNSMKRDGTLAALYEKWLGTKPGPDSSTVHVYTTPWQPK
ncbi:MAG: transporter substrate-binding domain-containing protein [Bilophila wadsworthia]